jgi:hypothetical protein
LFCLATLAVLAAVLGGAGCRREIGDECSTAADCDPSGRRACDLSQPGGYCTILACNETSCPEEAVCIRLFPTQFLTKPCVPACEDRAERCEAEGPERCPERCDDRSYDDCSAEELCVQPGLCAPRATERRLCAKACSGVDDCRAGYECRAAGTQGSVALAESPDADARFCAPAVSRGGVE